MVNLTRAYDIQLNRVSQQDISHSQYAPNASVLNIPGVIGDAVVVNGTWIYNFTLQDWTNSVAAGPYLPSLLGPSNSTSPSSTLSKTPSQTPAPFNGAGSPNISVIVGVIVAAVVVIAALAFYLLWLYRRRQPRKYRVSHYNHSGSAPSLHNPDSVLQKPGSVMHKSELISHKPELISHKPDRMSHKQDLNSPKPNAVANLKPHWVWERSHRSRSPSRNISDDKGRSNFHTMHLIE
ncbi:hypothetical protein BC938DRAFT_482768 [Jimgerdemannia flammicorona]|uniref:Uncharacterized protein n=1 Tax=Jimgerdemannia flammicorona TaxID=994334 RepID=A0A433QD98_9FUNG|nr:hypothetical protein BC938DRAFT_482768 [Jimgerdemannia flammicorona]